jgi:hypothetical protein
MRSSRETQGAILKERRRKAERADVEVKDEV